MFLKRKPLPSAEYLRSFFLYDKETGIVRWIDRPSRSKIEIGTVVGSPDSRGYLRVMIAKKTYKLHLIIWKIVTGDDPVREIDHWNLVKGDNRWGNLREAARFENGANVGLTARNTSGFKGVTAVPSGKWKASIRYRGELIYLGHHSTKEGAHAVYVAKARELCGSFARVA